MPKVVRGKTLLTYSDYVKIPEDGQRSLLRAFRGEFLSAMELCSPSC